MQIAGTQTENCNNRRDWVDSLEHNIQCSIYPRSTFRKLVNNYVPYAVECLFFPSRCVLKKTVEFSLPNPIDKRALMDSYFAVAGSHFARAVASFSQRSKNRNLRVTNP